MKPTRILFVNGGTMQRGGIESFMMSYYRNIERSKIQIDFIVHGFDKGAYDDEIRQMGGKIFNIPVKSKNYFENIYQLKQIFSSNEYKLVHSHMDAMNTLVLKVAKESGIPIRIAHSHNIDHLTTNKFKYLLNEFAKKRITRYATHFFACSEPAAKWLFGEELVQEKKVKIIKNAINLDDYYFNEKVRKEIRSDLNIENMLVLGHVGRFDYQKNHEYLLKIFQGLLETNANSRLILVGEGHLKKEISKKIKDMNLSDKVIMLGSRDNVNEILNSFDVFLLPSLFEGLGISLIEAQANGLRCIASKDTPIEVDITNTTTFISTKESKVSNWVEAILNIENTNRIIEKDNFILSGYDIKNEAKKLQDLYLDYLKEFI